MRLREKGKDEVVHLRLGRGSGRAPGRHARGGRCWRRGQRDRASLQEPTDESDDLDGKTRAELDALAAERGVDVSKATNKAEVIAALRAA